MSSESLVARQICQILDQGAREIDPTILERLRASRERALLRHAAGLDATESLGHGASATLQLGVSSRHALRDLLVIFLMLIGVICAYYWNGYSQAIDDEEIDSALLADDLPPNAYLDKGFQAWLDKDTSSGH